MMRQFKTDNFKIKRFGQVFSGKKVADLLVSLIPEDFSAESIIDPMAGVGDLLRAASIRYPDARDVVAVDIDKDVREQCGAAVPEATVYIGNAFDCPEIDRHDGWDLVITNPPYVRYQTLKTNPEIGLPDGGDIRRNLQMHIKNTPVLDSSERDLYMNLVNHYSGLSDMAVPAWILCASLVKMGGYLAMVVPETWLNRDYALPLQYLLLRCFEIRVVARDTESSWFEDAQVRTCLVVARRKKNEPLTNAYGQTELLEMGKAVADGASCVGKLSYKGRMGYDALSHIIADREKVEMEGFLAENIQPTSLFQGIYNKMADCKWVYGEDKINESFSRRLPKEMAVLVAPYPKTGYVTLEDLGWSIGQGLRTGANDFFYATFVSESEQGVMLQTNDWCGRQITVDGCNIRNCLKRRSDIDGITVNHDDLHNRIFYIQEQVRPEDYGSIPDKLLSRYGLLGRDLSDYVTLGGKYVSPKHGKPFRELSAVRTNEKKTEDGMERFWYMLPELKERHTPDLCIPRVCGGKVETLFVNQKPAQKIVVDANFTTLWNPDVNSHMIALALLNSTWTETFFELTGTLLGGGALKIEASHVRKLLFPEINEKNLLTLGNLGNIIVKKGYVSDEVRDEIDRVVLSSFAGCGLAEIHKGLKKMLVMKIGERTGFKH